MRRLETGSGCSSTLPTWLALNGASHFFIRAITMKRLLLIAVALILASPAFAQTTVQGVPIPRTTVNKSVVITTGNTFQTVLASTVARKAITVENNNATD